jgi:hypothetical protein
LGRLNLELDAGEIEEWALEIGEGLRIRNRIHGGSSGKRPKGVQ